MNLLRNSQFADPVDENGFGHCDGFLVPNGNGLCVLCLGVSHGEDVLVVLLGGFQWPEEIMVYPFIWEVLSRQRIERSLYL